MSGLTGAAQRTHAELLDFRPTGFRASDTMSDTNSKNDWLWWAVPLVLIAAAAAYLALSGDDASSQFAYDID